MKKSIIKLFRLSFLKLLLTSGLLCLVGYYTAPLNPKVSVMVAQSVQSNESQGPGAGRVNKYRAYQNRNNIENNVSFADRLARTPSVVSLSQSQQASQLEQKKLRQELARSTVIKTKEPSKNSKKLAKSKTASNNHSLQVAKTDHSTVELMRQKAKPFEAQIKAAANQYQIPPALIVGFMYQESRMNPKARSAVGATGLMQLMPGTAKHLGVTNIHDPAQNIAGGAKYIRQMYNQFGKLELAAAAYNAGPGNVRKHKGIPPFNETRKYVPKVLGYARAFMAAGGFEGMASQGSGYLVALEDVQSVQASAGIRA